MKSNVHVQVYDSKSKRRSILTSAKLVAEGLRDLDSLKKLRDKRKKKMEQLDSIMYDMKAAFNGLKIKDVPSVHLGEEAHEEAPAKQVVARAEPVKKEQPVTLGKKEMQLAKELDEIERKLASL